MSSFGLPAWPADNPKDDQLCGEWLVNSPEPHLYMRLYRQRHARSYADSLAEIPPERARIYLESFHHRIAVGLSLHPHAPGWKQSPARNLLERLRERADEVLRFADFPGWVSFTNNAGERALRPVKTQVKISGCHQSEDGAAHWLTVRSYLDSARKHGLTAFEAIHRAFTGKL